MRCSATTIAMPWRSRRSISVPDQLVGGGRVELARRLVEEQHRGPIARTEAIATRWRSPPDSVCVVPLGQVRGADHLQRGARAGMDLAGGDAQVLEAEGGLGEHVAHDDLGLGILEHEPGVPRELAGPVPARVEARDAHAPRSSPPWKCGTRPESGPKEGRLAASRLADEEHELALVHVRSTSASAGRPAGM